MTHSRPAPSPTLRTTPGPNPDPTAGPVAPVPAEASISALLKEHTAAQHQQAERHELQQRVARGTIDRPTWAAMTIQNRALQQALEDALSAAPEPRLARVFQPHHRRLANFDADLAALGVPLDQRDPLAETLAECNRIASLARQTPIALLGVLYVLEGSTNGGQFLARPLAKALGLPPGVGTSALNPHGARTRELWQAFRNAIDSLELAPEEVDAIIAAARETFEAVSRTMNAVAAGPALLSE